MNIRMLWLAATFLALQGCTEQPDLPLVTTGKWNTVAGRLDTGITRPMRNMEDVQAFVNRVPYMDDRANYGTDGYWAPPKEFFRRGRGDCEDYAIAKYALGLENHLFKPGDAKLVEALDLARGGTPHMLLVVRGKAYDNQTPRPFRLSGPEAARYALLGIVDTRRDERRIASR